LKVVTVIGARPQFIKAATVSRVLRQRNIREVIIHTGQHFDDNMSDVFFKEMDIPVPEHFLNINGLSHGAMTGQMLEKIEEVLKKEAPSIVLVYGDTNSTLAGALAASKLHIPVAHVEAGLRSFNMRMPEEVNRILTDRISAKLFCPTYTAINNLQSEGYQSMACEIFLSGDVMLDAATYYQRKADQLPTLEKHGLTPFEYFVCTIHRAENTDHLPNLVSIITALNELSSRAKVVVPLHPRTRKIIESQRIKTLFTIIDPVGYFDMINLTRYCVCVLTDSGGLQKEAYFFRRHCITMRDQTEWTELVDGGYNILTGANATKILDAVNHFTTTTFNTGDGLYGDGKAAEKIVENLAL
jgi:UDP-GlcNAc3NAcA epimerase